MQQQVGPAVQRCKITIWSYRVKSIGTVMGEMHFFSYWGTPTLVVETKIRGKGIEDVRFGKWERGQVWCEYIQQLVRYDLRFCLISVGCKSLKAPLDRFCESGFEHNQVWIRLIFFKLIDKFQYDCHFNYLTWKLGSSYSWHLLVIWQIHQQLLGIRK